MNQLWLSFYVPIKSSIRSKKIHFRERHWWTWFGVFLLFNKSEWIFLFSLILLNLFRLYFPISYRHVFRVWEWCSIFEMWASWSEWWIMCKNIQIDSFFFFLRDINFSHSIFNTIKIIFNWRSSLEWSFTSFCDILK